jgi:hypothetical protein
MEIRPSGTVIRHKRTAFNQFVTRTADRSIHHFSALQTKTAARFPGSRTGYSNQEIVKSGTDLRFP